MRTPSPRQHHTQIIERHPVAGAEPSGPLIGIGGARHIAFLKQKMTQPNMQGGVIGSGHNCFAQPVLVIGRAAIVLVRQEGLRPSHEYNRRWNRTLPLPAYSEGGISRTLFPIYEMSQRDQRSKCEADCGPRSIANSIGRSLGNRLSAVIGLTSSDRAGLATSHRHRP